MTSDQWHSHLMKTLEWLFFNLPTLWVQHTLPSRSWCYHVPPTQSPLTPKQRKMHRILCLYFSSVFNSFQPCLLQENMSRIQEDPWLAVWISNSLTDVCQAEDIMSDAVTSSIGAPQGTVLSHLLFTLYTLILLHLIMSQIVLHSEVCRQPSYHRVYQGWPGKGVQECGKEVPGATQTTCSSTPWIPKNWS